MTEAELKELNRDVIWPTIEALAEAKPKEALIAAFNRGYAYIDQRDKVTYVGPLVDALGFYHPGFYKLPIKESNE